MDQAKIYTLSNGQQITAYALAKQLKLCVSAARTRLSNSLDANKVFGSTESLYESIAKVWVLDNGFKGTAKELAKKAGIETATMNKRLKQSSNPIQVLKPKSTVNIGSTQYTLESGDIITAATYAMQHNMEVLDVHHELIVKASHVEYSLQKYYLSCGKEVTINEVMSITGVCHSGAKRRLEKSNIASFIFKKSSKVARNNNVFSKQNKSKIVAIRTYHMSSCKNTGAIQLRPL